MQLGQAHLNREQLLEQLAKLQNNMWGEEEDDND